MQLPDAPALVAAAKRRLQTLTDQDLAFELRKRYGVRVDATRVNRWGRDETKPNFESTIALVAAAGWFNETAVQAALRAATRAQAEEAARRAADLAENAKPPRRGKRRDTRA